MAHQHANSATDQNDHEHHAPGGIGKYIAVFVALCVLTTLSFLTYFDFWDQRVPPHISWAFMMAVSCTKAMLVVLFFMHLLWEANWKYVLTIPAAMMSVFLVLMLVPDVGCRVTRYSNQRWLHAAEPHEAAEEGTDGQLLESSGDHATGDSSNH
jgi:cytochrome c oxidase subunit 4